MRLPPEIERELEACGLPWTVDKGKKHHKIRVAGRMVGILPLNGKVQTSNKTPIKNTVAQIRRAAKELSTNRR